MSIFDYDNYGGDFTDSSDFSYMNPRQAAPSNPFTMARAASIFNQPVTSQAPAPNFNPKQFVPDSPYSTGGFQKRLMTDLIPKQTYQPPQQQPRSSTWDYFKMLQDISSQHPAEDAYLSAVSKPPQSSQYQPSGWRRFGSAVLGGLTGFASKDPMQAIEAAQMGVSTPYRTALQDYATRIGGLKSAADIESKGQDQTTQNLVAAIHYGSDADYKTAELQDKRTQGGREIGLKYAQLQADMEEKQRKYEVDIRNAASAERRNEITAAHNKDLADYNKIMSGVAQSNAYTNRLNAGSNATRAGAAVDSAEAAKAAAAAAQDRANRTPRGPSPQQQEDARNLALRSMADEGFLGVKYSGDKLKPEVITDPRFAQMIGPELDKRVRRILAQQAGQVVGGQGGLPDMPAESPFNVPAPGRGILR